MRISKKAEAKRETVDEAPVAESVADGVSCKHTALAQEGGATVCLLCGGQV